MATENATSFDLLGKRWSALIVQELIHGPLRFRELLNHLSRINDKVLSQRLKELAAANILRREVFAEVPIRVEYSLSEKGRSLANVVKEMERWDSRWSDGKGGTNGHTVEGRAEKAEPEPVGAGRPTTARRGLLKRLGL